MAATAAAAATVQVIGMMNESSDQVNATVMPASDDTRFPLYMRIAGTLACAIIFTIGVTGNLLVPLVVIKTKYLRNSTNLFLINLSIADLLVLIVCMPTMIIELHSRPETWLLGEPMCKISNYVETLAANGSISTILAISFERYYAICKPLKAGYKCTRLRAAIIICVIWILASILSSPIYMMAKSSQTVYGPDKSLVYNCILGTDTYWSQMYVFVSMFAFFCLPLLVLMLVYWLISRRLIRENVAMMDSSTTRNNLIDSRGNIAQSSQHAPLTGGTKGHHQQRGSNMLHFRRPDHKRASSSSTSAALSSLFNSIRHYNYYGQKAAHDTIPDSHTQKCAHRFESVLVTQPNVATKISAQMSADHARGNNSCQRRSLAVGKAMSLDYGASRITSETTDNHSHGSADGPLVSVQAANGQPLWSGNSAVFHSRATTDSSNADVTTSATTSTTDADIQTNCRQGSPSSSPASVRTTLLPSWMFSTNLSELMGQLLGISSKFKSTGNDHGTNQDKTMDSAKSESAFNDDIIAAERQRGRSFAADINISAETFCDRALISEHRTDRDNINASVSKQVFGEARNHSDQFEMPLVKSNMINCVGGGDGKQSTGREDVDHSSNQNINQVTTVKSRSTETTGYNHRRDRGDANQTGKLESKRRTKKSVESRKQRYRQNSQDQVRSRFKWVKGFSVSSSTGSTYTNSTFLPSDTGSISPSLLNSSRQQNSPSPPRPAGAGMHGTASASPDGVELSLYQSPIDGSAEAGGSRACSPGKLNRGERKKITHFDEVVDVGEIDLAPSHSSRRRTHPSGRHPSTNSESSSGSAANTSGSERSLSPVGSLSNAPAEMSTTAKTTWLESCTLLEQHDSHPRSLQRTLAQPPRLRQHDEEEQIDSNTKYDYCQNRRSTIEIDRQCINSEVRSVRVESRLHCEVIDACGITQGRATDKPRAEQGESDEYGAGRIGMMTNKGRVVRSLTEDQAPLRTKYLDEIERIKLFPIDTGITPLQRQYDMGSSPSSRTPAARHSIVNAHKHISKVNLIAMAQNLSDNLHFKRNKQRSGSHPVVSHHMHANNESNAGAHNEFLAVRDVSKRQQMDSRRQVVAMLAFVVACFFSLFLPYRVFTIWCILSTEEQVQSLGAEAYYNISYFARTLIYLHSAINPIAYNLISTKFRRAFMSILLCRGPATRRNFTADPHRFFPYDSKGQLNANQNRSTGTANGNGSGSRGPRSPRVPTR